MEVSVCEGEPAAAPEENSEASDAEEKLTSTGETAASPNKKSRRKSRKRKKTKQKAE